MLNPSTADELKLDPSCTRARLYAQRWGFGALVVTNLFAWRATDPKNLKRAREPVGRGNDSAILRAACSAGLVVCAWGNHGAHRDRSAAVLEMLRDAVAKCHVRPRSGGGEPAHPLYMPKPLEARRWQAK